MNRKAFLRLAASSVVILANGHCVRAADYFDENRKKKVAFRFAIASDGHYGQPETAYQQYFFELVQAVNGEHAKKAFQFCVVNGDIIHDDKTHFPAAKAALDGLSMPYYVSQGNHDMCTAQEWEAIWKMPVNLDFEYKDHAFLVGTTSNETGKYICPDLAWFQQALAKHAGKKNIFVFVHINPAKLTKHGIDCPDFVAELSKFKNVRAVFNGHDHDEEKIKLHNNIPFVFDAHFGGNWGTPYRGYRIVEVLKDNSIHTYIMNPFQKINAENI